MKNKLFFNTLLIFIVFLAFILRIYNLSGNPPSPTWDEVSWGYNAYSLGIDGKDEFGKFLPLDFIESFGDFKPPVYAYLAVIPVSIFGLNDFSTRLPSAFFGTLTVFLTFFLVRKIFSEKGKTDPDSEWIAIISAGLLAISPWHILLSRAAFEANVSSFFIVLGIYLFIVSLTKRWFLVLSVISFVISMYTFNTARIVSPLLLVALVIVYRNYFLTKARFSLVFSVIVGAIIFIPLFLFLLTPQSKLRYNEVNIFTDPSVVENANTYIENDGNAFWSKIIHNRRLGYTVEYFKHYLDNFTPEFLFVRGDGNPKFSVQNMGQMYTWEIPFLFFGALFLFRKRKGYWWIIPYWLIVGVIPAGTARETPHALRIETIIPTLQIITACGIYYVSVWVKNLKLSWGRVNVGKILGVAFFIGLAGAVLLNLSYFLHTYFVHYPKQYSSEWQYGYKEVVEFASQNKDKFDNVYMTEDLGRPYIYFLYYEKYDPVKFRRDAKVDREVLGFVHVNSFDKYRFVKNVANKIDTTKNNLYIDSIGKIPAQAEILKEFRTLNGLQIMAAYTF